MFNCGDTEQNALVGLALEARGAGPTPLLPSRTSHLCPVCDYHSSFLLTPSHLSISCGQTQALGLLPEEERERPAPVLPWETAAQVGDCSAAWGPTPCHFSDSPNRLDHRIVSSYLDLLVIINTGHRTKISPQSFCKYKVM